jgi:hypothetical protein
MSLTRRRLQKDYYRASCAAVQSPLQPPAPPVGLGAVGVLAHDPEVDQWLLLTSHHVLMVWRGNITRRWPATDRSSALAVWDSYRASSAK